MGDPLPIKHLEAGRESSLPPRPLLDRHRSRSLLGEQLQGGNPQSKPPRPSPRPVRELPVHGLASLPLFPPIPMTTPIPPGPAFSSAAYRQAYASYLPMADAYARPITAAVRADEDEHLSYGERWLGSRFAAVEPAVQAITRQALPISLAILRAVVPDLKAIGIDPLELMGVFQQRFRQALVAIGYGTAEAQALVWRSTLTAAF